MRGKLAVIDAIHARPIDAEEMHSTHVQVVDQLRCGVGRVSVELALGVERPGEDQHTGRVNLAYEILDLDASSAGSIRHDYLAPPEVALNVALIDRRAPGQVVTRCVGVRSGMRRPPVGCAHGARAPGFEGHRMAVPHERCTLVSKSRPPLHVGSDGNGKIVETRSDDSGHAASLTLDRRVENGKGETKKAKKPSGFCPQTAGKKTAVCG